MFQNMLHNIFRTICLSLGVLVLAVGCSSHPHKAEKVETTIDNKGEVTGGEKLGIKDGNMVVQRKVLMAEELRGLQIEVYETEDRVYGNRKFGSAGKYGILKQCRTQLASKNNGGDGKLRWQEPIDRVTDKEEELKIGLDEKNELVGVTEEFLKDRLDRFRKYKQILQKREDEMQEKIEICEADLAAQKHNATQKTSKVE